MNNFIPPVKGTKLGEFEPTRLKRLYNLIVDFIAPILGFIAPWLLCILLVRIGYILIKDPFNPKWASSIIGSISFLFGVSQFLGIVIDLFTDNGRKPIKINKKKLSLFLVDNGVEINENFIPFKGIDYSSNNFSREGIMFFKLDGEYLLIKTDGDPFILYCHELNENQIKFKIESKYHSCKEELLLYLNNMIPQN
jgi:hypothetical protein